MYNFKKNNRSLIKFPTLFFLSIASIILLVTSFVYIMIARDGQANSEPYYKISNITHSNFTTITQKKRWTQIDFNFAIEFLAKQKIDQSFIAQTDNLGIIAIPFDTHNRSINDKIIFRLKETDRKDWYYQATYDAKQFQNNVPFPLGFPVIKNSRNKSYAFQIESLIGAPDNSVSLSKSNTYFFTKYKFSKSELIKNPYKLLQFLIAKTIEQARLLTMHEIFLIFFSFLSPFIIFVFWNNLGKYLNVKKASEYIFMFLKSGISNFNAENRRLLIKKIKDFLYDSNMQVLVILLLLTLLTRFSISYTDKSNIIVAPEIKFLNERGIGSDYRVGVIDAVDLMIHGKSIYTRIQNYGSGFTLLTTLPIYLLNSYSICSIKDIASCHIFLYRSLVLITLGGYLLFIYLVSYKKKELLSFLLLYFIMFLLSIFGSSGLERGNIDIILSLFIGFLILWIFQKNRFNLLLKSIAIGFICAFLVNTKLFILPIAIAAIYSSRRMLVAFLSFILSFSLLGYLPNILFHSPSNPFSPISTALVVAHVNSFAVIYRLQYNYSFNALASIATNCLEKQTCKTYYDSMVISIISLFLFIFTFIFPFLTTITIRNKLLNLVKKADFKSSMFFIKSGLQWLIKQRLNKHFIILLFILSVAALILLPEQTYPYRLYYALPILMILWKETESNKRARIYCLLSIIFLSIKGLWIFMSAYPTGFNIFDTRGMVVFVILGFYFMIRAGIALIAENKMA